MFDQHTVELIRTRARDTEQKGELPQEVLEIIYDKQLFKLYVPDELNGRMTSFTEAIKVFEEAAWIDGSFGWLVQIGSGAGFFVTTMEPDWAREVFSKREVYIAGSDRASGEAVPVDGGFLVTGKWKFCSGSKHATAFTANAHIKGANVTRAFTFLPEQVEVIEDWDAFGLKGTNSHTFKVDDVFVPNNRTFDVLKPHFHYDDHVYHYPFLPFAAANIAATTIGIARHFFDEAKSQIKSKKELWNQYEPGRFDNVMNKILEMEKPFIEAVEKFYSSIEHSWDQHVNGELVSDLDLIDIEDACKTVAEHAVHGAQVIYRYLGMGAIMESSDINRIYRDLHTASQHKLLI
ncbi:acyl-CoA dehydrogenase family protein [Piscibacillus sp. B03]|uniref:acyl-CoA dehydrogenase family protein n=1 Tax=Piscibacillus sp. B03 TaxID=3457430 RepID=UPI003FCD4846